MKTTRSLSNTSDYLAAGKAECATLDSLYESIGFIEHIKGEMYKWEHKLHDSFNTRAHVCAKP